MKDDRSMINLNKNAVPVLFLLEPQAAGWTFGCSQAGKNGDLVCLEIETGPGRGICTDK